MSLISPLNRVLGLGSAKDGVGHWWAQRLTAVALVPLGLWFAISLAGIDMRSHGAIVAWMAQPMPAVLLILSVTTLIYHSYLGVTVVVEDYVESHARKTVVLVLSVFLHIFLLTASVFSILKVAFGAA